MSYLNLNLSLNLSLNYHSHREIPAQAYRTAGRPSDPHPHLCWCYYLSLHLGLVRYLGLVSRLVPSVRVQSGEEVSLQIKTTLYPILENLENLENLETLCPIGGRQGSL